MENPIALYLTMFGAALAWGVFTREYYKFKATLTDDSNHSATNPVIYYLTERKDCDWFENKLDKAINDIDEAKPKKATPKTQPVKIKKRNWLD